MTDKEQLNLLKNKYPKIWANIKRLCPCSFGIYKNGCCFCDEDIMKKCWKEALK